nr:hypothetical protein CFP56_36800 [Quercus suber]
MDMEWEGLTHWDPQEWKGLGSEQFREVRANTALPALVLLFSSLVISSSTIKLRGSASLCWTDTCSSNIESTALKSGNLSVSYRI